MGTTGHRALAHSSQETQAWGRVWLPDLAGELVTSDALGTMECKDPKDAQARCSGTGL